MPSPQEYYEALVTVIETGEARKVGSTILSPKREWPLSATALYELAVDFAKAEADGRDCGRCG